MKKSSFEDKGVDNMGFDALRQRGNAAEGVEVNFKTSLGGFDKDEVTAYISELVSNFQNAQDALVEKATSLGDEVAVLRREKELSIEKIKEYKAREAEREFNNNTPQMAGVAGIEGLHVLQKENKSLVEENRALTSEYNSLLSSNDKLRADMEKIRSEISAISEEKNTLSSANILLSAQVESYSAQSDGLREQIRSLADGNTSLRDQLGKANANVSQLRSDLSELSNKSAELSAEIDILKFNNASLNEEKIALLDNISSMTSQLDFLKDEVERFKLTENKLLGDIERNAKELENSEEKINELTNELAKSNAEKQELSSNVKELQVKISVLENSQAEAGNQSDEKIAEYETKISALSEEISKSVAERTALLSTVEQLQNQISLMKDQQTSSGVVNDEQIAEYKEKVVELTAENSKAIFAKQSLEADNQKLKKHIQELENSLQSDGEQSASLLLQINEFGALKTQLEGKITQLQDQISQFEKDKSDYMEEKDRLISQFTAARNAYNQLKLQSDQGVNTQDMERITSELNSVKEENLRLTNQVSDLRTKIALAASGSADTSKLEGELAEIKKHRKELSEENDKHIQENSKLTLEINNLKESYDRIAAERDEALANLSKGTTPVSNVKISQLEEQIKKLDIENSRLKTDTAMYQHEKDRLLNEIKMARSMCENAEKERDQLKMSSENFGGFAEDELRLEVSKLKSDNAKFISELKNYEAERKRLLDELNVLRNSQSQMMFEKDDIAVRMQSLDKTNSEMSQKQDAIMSEFEMYRSKNLDLLNKIDELQEKIEFMKSNEESLTNENTYLTNRLQSLKLINSQLEQGGGYSRSTPPPAPTTSTETESHTNKTKKSRGLF